jgi:uncharacterized C2H2 Zn-finger protein
MIKIEDKDGEHTFICGKEEALQKYAESFAKTNIDGEYLFICNKVQMKLEIVSVGFKDGIKRHRLIKVEEV